MIGNSEYETTKARVLIISQYFPEYSIALEKSINYVKQDPSSGLLKCRQILEELCKNIWLKYNDNQPPSIYEIFNDHKIKSNTPKRILNRMHSLRTICNLGIHGEIVHDVDVLLCLNHLFVIFDWYHINHNNSNPLPVAVEPSHNFTQYIKDSYKDKIFMFFIALIIIFPALIFAFHNKLPIALSRPFQTSYEGVFVKGAYIINGVTFSFLFSIILVFTTSILSWYIFRRFRSQDSKSRIISFILTYTAVFGSQYFILHILDYYTRVF
jgi:hypothetical protein